MDSKRDSKRFYQNNVFCIIETITSQLHFMTLSIFPWPQKACASHAPLICCHTDTGVKYWSEPRKWCMLFGTTEIHSMSVFLWPQKSCPSLGSPVCSCNFTPVCGGRHMTGALLRHDFWAKEIHSL